MDAFWLGLTLILILLSLALVALCDHSEHPS
jgi:hypothetical protein